jgi:DNA polymerase elongation subunit (family B)
LPNVDIDYDPEYYINNQLITSVEKILEVFNISREEIEQKKDQKKLGEF